MSDPYEVFKGVRVVPFRAPADPARAASEMSYAAHVVAAYTEPPEPEGRPDYTAWMTVQEVADLLGIAYNSAIKQVYRHCTWAKVFGRVLVEPESAARYQMAHSIMRRTPAPDR